MSAWSNRVIYMFERRCLPLAVLAVVLAGCGSTGDGSVGIGSGQSLSLIHISEPTRH